MQFVTQHVTPLSRATATLVWRCNNIEQQEVQVMGTTRWNQIAFLIGRVMVGGMYLGAGIANLIELDGKAGYTASKGVPDPKLWVTLASLLLVAAGFSFITGLRPPIGIAALVLFLIPVTLIMHNFWVFDGMQRVAEMHSFLSNLALLGSGVMFLAIPRPWPLSLDHWIVALGDRVRSRMASSARPEALLNSEN
ncbi:MAG: DoxX family membrane protein [Roseiflexaceae bacterium]